LSLAAAATLSPGPAVLLAVRNGAQLGFRRSLFGIAGNVLAMLSYGLMATVGVAVVFGAFPFFALGAQVLGGAYLIYLGLKLILNKNEASVTGSTLSAGLPSSSSLFTEAYFVGLSNPKALLFYSALFPQFVKAGENIALQSSTLALTFAVCSFSALCLYSYLASRMASRFTSRRMWSLVNRVSGVVFAGLGGGLIVNSGLR